MIGRHRPKKLYLMITGLHSTSGRNAMYSSLMFLIFDMGSKHKFAIFVCHWTYNVVNVHVLVSRCEILHC